VRRPVKVDVTGRFKQMYDRVSKKADVFNYIEDPTWLIDTKRLP
jgi:hypothetical protein